MVGIAAGRLGWSGNGEGEGQGGAHGHQGDERSSQKLGHFVYPRELGAGGHGLMPVSRCVERPYRPAPLNSL